MKRPPRHGWSLVELRDGRWHLATTGDREQVKGAFSARVSTMYSTPIDASVRYSMRFAGKGVALFDAAGQRRDEFPHALRLPDGTRLLWPSTLPANGEEPVVMPERGSDP